jgi:hypothetical protein
MAIVRIPTIGLTLVVRYPDKTRGLCLLIAICTLSSHCSRGPVRLRSRSCRQRLPLTARHVLARAFVAGMRCLRPTAIQIENRRIAQESKYSLGFCPATGLPPCLLRYTSGPPSASSLRSRGREYKQTPSLLARILLFSRSGFTRICAIYAYGTVLGRTGTRADS